MNKNKVMDFFSALGRSLLMPIAALAACGIVLGPVSYTHLTLPTT